MSISISEVRPLAGCAMRLPFHHVLAFLPFCDAPARRAIDDDLDGWPEIALTNVVRMPLVLGLGDSAAALELERRLEKVFGELES
jgi:hypothetical protein